MTAMNSTRLPATELHLIKQEGKALLALMDEYVGKLAVLTGSQERVLVPFSTHGYPNGNYHRDAPHARCGRISRRTELRYVSEHDAAKLLRRCRFCSWPPST